MDEAQPAGFSDVADHELTDPWQARAVALAVALVGSLDLTWDDFRSRLMAEVSREPDREYYASWMAALESLALETESVSDAALLSHREEAATYRTSVDGQRVEVLALDASPVVVDGVLADLTARGVTVAIDSRECRHLELHRVHGGAHSVCAYGTGGVALLDVVVDAELWNLLADRYVGAVTSPAPTMASRSTSAASSSTSMSSVPGGRSGSTK